MNQSDDDIFGRNIDQLDRETPRYNLSEEEDNNANGEASLKKNQNKEKKMSASSLKTPSIASVQPYSRASAQPPVVLSPHPSKKSILTANNEIPQPPPVVPSSSAPYYNQRFGVNTAPNYTGPPKLNSFPPPNGGTIPSMKMPRQLTEISAQIHTHPTSITPQAISQPPPLAMDGNPQLCGVPMCSIPQQMHTDGNPPMNASFMMNQQPPPPVIRVGPPDQCPCYCPDCIHGGPQMSQQLVINSERQKIEDEILLRQRELDSCWQEDELDCPRDFTAIDRKKEKFYAQRIGNDKFQRCGSDVHSNHSQGWHQEDAPDPAKESLLNRETKTSVDPTQAFPTAVSRNHQIANAPAPTVASMAAPVKTKAQAVVSPLPRTIAQKKVNINTVVSRFSYSNEPENPQDYTSSGWPQSEMGSRIPSSERINLSPLCMSGVPSGIQTPVEPGTGQKPITPSDLPNNSVPRATQLQQLPGHENKKKASILDKFKGNEQYKRSLSFPQGPAGDSVKDFTTSKWPQSEMGSRIPSSERISLSPLTMSGVPSAVQSGVQTPLEPNTGAIPLKSLLKRPDTSSPPKCNHPVEKHDSIDESLSGGTPNENQPPQNEHDTMRDFSKVLQSELTSRVPSIERICLSPLCQSGIPSGCQTPQEDVEPESVINEDGVKLRGSKQKHVNDSKLEEVMSRMNITDNRAVPRFDYVEEDSVKDFSRPEMSSRMQSYENLNFTPPWSSSNSGIATPCDVAGLYGGSKPLRDQPLIEENEEESSNNNNSEANKDKDNAQGSSGEHIEDQVVHDEKPADELNRQPSTSDSDGCKKPTMSGDATFGGDAEHKQHFHEMQKECQSGEGMTTVEMCSNQNQHHSRQAQLAPPKRRNSWSSVESTSSNRTDISTVVNAPTSMHNTAPGSPDPDGSEASDSDISDQENVDVEPNLSDTFSNAGSPHMQQKRRVNPVSHHQVPQQQYQGQKRWANQHEERQPGNQIPYPDDCCNNRPNQNNMRGAPPQQEDQVKSLIKMAKEKFSMKSPVQGGCSDIPNDPSRSPQMHVNRYPPPPQAQRMMPQGSAIYYQPPCEGQGSVYYDNHPPDTGQRYHPHNYPQHYPPHQNNNYPAHMGKPGVMSDSQQRPFPANPIAPMHALARQPPRMQAIPESQVPPMMHPHNVCHQGPSGEMKKGNLGHGHQGGPAGSMPYPRPMMNAQQIAHVSQPYYGEPMNMHPRGIAPNADEERSTGLFPPTSCQQRAYSITSLEPNRPSPPHTDALDTISVVSFASMAASNQNLDTKADMMSSLLSMLGTHDPDDMARTLLAMSSSPDSCAAMRQSGCVPLLIKLLHSQNYDNGKINWGARQRAGLALHKIVHSNDGDRRGKREMRVLRLLEIIRTHSEAILSKDDENYRANRSAPPLRDHGPGPAVAAIMKLSFEEEHKNTICELGGLQTIGEILAVDYMANKECNDPYAIALRKYAGMVLINLTYNDSKNKAVLCSMTNTLKSIIGQLSLTHEEDIIQVFAGIIRNISWRPDENTQRALQTINAVRALMTCIQSLRAEVCIRAVLSAVWNLSAHNSENKEEICRTTGSLKFLAYALSYRSPNNSLVVVENAGGILRNVSSHIAINPEYRKILHQEGCLQTLVSQLRSTSTRVVSNACGVLWNLSARCIEDQELLWELGAVSVLKTLVNSKHKSISASSASALRNLLAVKPGSSTDTDSHVSFQPRSQTLPTKIKIQKYRSVGARSGELGKHDSEHTKRRFRVNKNNYQNQRVDSQSHYFDLYKEPPVRQNIIGGPCGADDENQSQYTDISPSASFRKIHGGENKLHEMNNARVHRMYGSSSSCSSFSPKEKPPQYRMPAAYPATNISNPSEIKIESEKETVCSEKESGLPDESCSDYCEPKLYDDCKLSNCRDVVLMYKETPKISHKLLPKKSKLHSSRLSMKFKKHSLKKSMDSVMSSRDSVLDKSDCEKAKTMVNEKKKSSKDEKRENVWIKTKALKQKLLNRSHSSDLAFDKSVGGLSTTRKSPFEIYSMSTFPDRVASDQCLSTTEKHLRDDLMNMRANNDIQHGNEMHHGSWSSCECKEERIFPANHGDFLSTHTPLSITKHNHDRQNDIMTQQNDMPHQQFKYNDGGSPTDQSFYSAHSASGHNDLQYHSAPLHDELPSYTQAQSMYTLYPTLPTSSSSQQMYVTNQSNLDTNNGHLISQPTEIHSETDMKKQNSKFKKSSILKNPLKKSSGDSSNKQPKVKRNEKKLKKRSGDEL